MRAAMWATPKLPFAGFGSWVRTCLGLEVEKVPRLMFWKIKLNKPCNRTSANLASLDKFPRYKTQKADGRLLFCRHFNHIIKSTAEFT